MILDHFLKDLPRSEYIPIEIDEDCYDWGFDYAGADMALEPIITATSSLCQETCQTTPGCQFWTFKDSMCNNECWLKTKKNSKNDHWCAVSGPRYCS
jgi:hypothetical protein